VSSFSGLQRWLQPYASELVRYFPELRITSVRRSRTEQIKLWNTRANNPYPVAPPGSSYHEYGRAWDMVGDHSRLVAAGRLWRSWGGQWFEADPIHFQA